MHLQEIDLFELKTIPKPERGIVLVTGATGYIGGQLVPVLISRGYSVRVMVRRKSPEHSVKWPGAEIIEADALYYDEIEMALKDVSVAYYLIHSLLLGKMAFESLDIRAANNFRIAAEKNGLQQIIYLCGLGKEDTSLSHHLENRLRVASELQAGNVPVTVLRAAIIVGSGSASYEILKNLILNSSGFLIPSWARTLCQPIALEDVIKYLVGSVETEKTIGKTFDIGGNEVLSYEEMLKKIGIILRKKRFFIPSFFSNTNLYGYFASLLTPVPSPITKCLMEGTKNEVICQNTHIRELIPFEPLSYEEAVLRALSREEQDKIYTRWSDAYPPAHDLAIKLHEMKHPLRYVSEYHLDTQKNEADLFSSICAIGGKQGWFYTNWMWRMRGILDRLIQGVGTSRGRKSSSSLMINDVIDFWRVENLIKDKLLLLRAEMILPGKAWLEFRIQKNKNTNRLFVTAYFQPSNWTGHIYWYNFLPFHFIIFRDLLRQIEKKS